MGTKYLGEQFDIHGGGLDLIFPHHEAEIAQSCAALGKESVHYWMHNNMITIAGKKMGKSYNNFITLEQFFSGNHPLLSKPFGPMVIRFFILQAHYRSTVDFSSEALEAAEKGLQRLQEAYARLLKIKPSEQTALPFREGEGVGLASLRTRCAEAMDDDLNTPFVIAALFDSVRTINTVWDGKGTISEADLAELRDVWKTYAIDILGLRLEEEGSSLQGGDGGRLSAFHGAIDLLLGIRLQAKQNKDWATSDKIRNSLTDLGFQIKDTKDGFEWSI
jgi:cysteinyl-tRNA synthetase